MADSFERDMNIERVDDNGRFDEVTPYDSIIFGSDKMILETELNEMQYLQRQKIRDILKIYGDCLLLYNGDDMVPDTDYITENGDYIRCNYGHINISCHVIYSGYIGYLRYEADIEWISDAGPIYYLCTKISEDISVVDDRYNIETTRRRKIDFKVAKDGETPDGYTQCCPIFQLGIIGSYYTTFLMPVKRCNSYIDGYANKRPNTISIHNGTIDSSNVPDFIGFGHNYNVLSNNKYTRNIIIGSSATDSDSDSNLITIGCGDKDSRKNLLTLSLYGFLRMKNIRQMIYDSNNMIFEYIPDDFMMHFSPSHKLKFDNGFVIRNNNDDDVLELISNMFMLYKTINVYGLDNAGSGVTVRNMELNTNGNISTNGIIYCNNKITGKSIQSNGTISANGRISTGSDITSYGITSYTAISASGQISGNTLKSTGNTTVGGNINSLKINNGGSANICVFYPDYWCDINRGIKFVTYDGSIFMHPCKDNYAVFGSSNERWKQIYACTSAISTSDRREKYDISYIGHDSEYDTAMTDEQLTKFIMGLLPVIYRMKDGDSKRPHHGIISQDFEELLKEIGLSDHAAFIKSPKTEKVEVVTGIENDEFVTCEILEEIDNEYRYGIRYEELISDNIRFSQILYDMVQEQDKTIKEQQDKINNLESRLKSLEDIISKLV